MNGGTPNVHQYSSSTLSIPLPERNPAQCEELIKDKNQKGHETTLFLVFWHKKQEEAQRCQDTVLQGQGDRRFFKHFSLTAYL